MTSGFNDRTRDQSHLYLVFGPRKGVKSPIPGVWAKEGGEEDRRETESKCDMKRQTSTCDEYVTVVCVYQLVIVIRPSKIVVNL